MGFIWKIGNGRNIKFWEDNWLGSYSIAIQYWELYRIVNEQMITIPDLWDVSNLKCTFRKLVDNRLMSQWLEVEQLAATIVYSEDSMVWLFQSSGVHSSQSLYKVITFLGGSRLSISQLSVL